MKLNWISHFLCEEDGFTEQAGMVLCSEADIAHFREKGVDFWNLY